MTPQAIAAELMAELGGALATQHAAAVMHGMTTSGDDSRREQWRAVQRTLTMMLARQWPAPLDVNRTAERMIQAHGRQGAARIAEQRASEVEGSQEVLVAWHRIGEAVQTVPPR